METNIRKRVFLDAGHSLVDSGARSGNLVESEINRKVRDQLVPLLSSRYEVVVVPDNLNLRESIAWVNERAQSVNDGLAFSIHTNCCGGAGAECYYYRNNPLSRSLAVRLIDEYCSRMGLPNRGARSSSATRFGRLGWVEDTSCWALILEMGFIDSFPDMLLVQDHQRTARAIVAGIDRVFGLASAPDISVRPEVSLDEGSSPGLIQAQILRIAEMLKVVKAQIERLLLQK